MNKYIRLILWIAASLIGYIGFRFVTQAGQGLGVVQNDGYGAIGGIMLLLSGILFGLLYERKNNGKH